MEKQLEKRSGNAAQSSQRVLFLGCGDIASRAIRRLDTGKWEVAGMRRSVDRLPVGICRFGGDVCDREALQKIILEWRPQVIVVSLTPAAMSDEGYRDSYVAGAEALLAAFSETALSPLVLWVSSTGVYGQDAGEWVSEESDTQSCNPLLGHTPRSLDSSYLLNVDE